MKRPDGSIYETEFAKCYTCCAMYHWPQPVPAFIPDGGAPANWGTVCGSGKDGGGEQLTQQQHNDILSKAAVARKSRKRR